MSIKPEYADAIFSGEKKYEFRRSVFRRPVTTVVIYVTTPVAMVEGEFDVVRIIETDIERLWRRTEHAAGIHRKAFFDYFSGREVGYAIEIGQVRRYGAPVCIDKKYGIRPPQSFAYV